MSAEIPEKPKSTHGGARPGTGGARSNSGRKSKFDEAELMTILDAGWPKSKRIAAVQAMAARAEDGDVAAFSILMAHSYGKPKQAVDVTSSGEKLKGYIGFDPEDV